MRIWLQSVGSLGSEPKWAEYEKALVKHAQSVVRPDTKVVVRGVKTMIPGMDRSHYCETLNTAGVISNAIAVEKEGYDAFAVNCMMDPGFFQLKEVVSFPVAHALQSSLLVATLLAPSFALLSYDENQRRWVSDTVRQYGFGDRLVPSKSFSTNLEALVEGFKDPSAVLKGAKQAARSAAENGADMLIPTCGCLNTIFAANGIKELEGIPLVDTVGSVLKMAELLVDLRKMGMDRVNRGAYTRLSTEELAAVRQLAGAK